MLNSVLVFRCLIPTHFETSQVVNWRKKLSFFNKHIKVAESGKMRKNTKNNNSDIKTEQNKDFARVI